MFLRNAWYVAAIRHEIGAQPFARTLLNEPIVLFRTDAGNVVALEDRCCHRSMPLSYGRRIPGDRLQCGYHGLEFDASGACVKVPGQSQAPPGARVRSYPAVERFGWVWVWMGDPAKADESTLPDWHWMESKDWATVWPAMIPVKCNYQLIADNVLDVTHLAYVHTTSIGNSAINEFPVRCERDGRKVRMVRWVLDRPAPPMYQNAGQFDGNVDRWQIVEHIPPCYSVNFAGCGQPAGRGAKGGHNKMIDLKAMSAPTPETENSCHYFFAFSRSFGLDDAEADKMCSVDLVRVFREDVGILEAQQRMRERKPGAPMVDINVDAAPLAARRALDAMLEIERADR